MEKEQDDIEYNITFPSPNDNEVEPVVFLLGWFGAQDRHLAKYCDIWANEGCTTIRYIHKTNTIFFEDPVKSKGLRHAARKLLQLLDDYGLRNNPVIIHSFSNGGFFIYYHLADIFEMEDVNMIGAVFDSSPAKLEYFTGSRAVYYSGMPKLAAILVILGFGIYYFVWKIFIWFGLTVDLFQESARRKSQRWPSLFLYSSADVVVPCHQIKEMLNKRRMISKCYSHDFQTSAHCLHFREHREVYLNKCVEFLNNCLEIWDENE
uniref:Transmembrane protein 53 n=1 Tax=Phallusia mammillata TaxID=59560 RepID=A0A6F9DVP4_9ASCI|nr:transmembrane protein 53 [Phallusia mammillata]